MTGEPHRYEKPSRKHRKSEFKGWNGLRALTARFSVSQSGEPHRHEKSSRFLRHVYSRIGGGGVCLKVPKRA